MSTQYGWPWRIVDIQLQFAVLIGSRFFSHFYYTNVATNVVPQYTTYSLGASLTPAHKPGSGPGSFANPDKQTHSDGERAGRASNEAHNPTEARRRKHTAFMARGLTTSLTTLSN